MTKDLTETLLTIALATAAIVVTYSLFGSWLINLYEQSFALLPQ